MMKKSILTRITLLVLLLILACEEPKDVRQVKESYPVVTKIKVLTGEDSVRVYLYIIDSCEYIGRVWGDNRDFLTHRGNCHNSIHQKIYKKNGK